MPSWIDAVPCAGVPTLARVKPGPASFARTSTSTDCPACTLAASGLATGGTGRTGVTGAAVTVMARTAVAVRPSASNRV